MARGPGRPPTREEGDVFAVPLFESGHSGYGDGRLVSNPHRYNRVFGSLDLRQPGELRMGDSFTTLAYPATFSRPPVWVGQARNVSGGAEGRYQAIIFAIDTEIVEIVNGAIAQRVSGTALIAAGAQAISDCAIHDNGSGVPRLVVAFGDAAAIRHVNLLTNAVTVGTVTNDKLASVSGALYASAIPSGAGRFNGIRFCPYGADPATAANWSSITRVGWSSTDINQIISVRGVPCALKPEGVFTYNRSLDQWENMMPGWEQEPHPNNGRGAFSLGPNSVIPLGRGGAILFDGYSVRDFSPYGPLAAPVQDTTSQMLSCMGTYRNWIVGVTAVNHGFVGGAGSKETHDLGGFSSFNQKELAVGNTPVAESIRFWRTQDNEVTFTDGSANAGDGSLATTVTLDAQDTAANGDFFTIGYRYPIRAVIIEFDIGAAQVNTTARTLTVEYASSATAWSSMAFFDFTSLSGATLGQSGLIVFTGNPTDWTTRTYGTAGTDATAGYYYLRFSLSGALSATVRIANVRVIPWRPAIDTTDFANDGIDRSGVYPHLLMGRPGTEEGQAVWQDMGTPAVPDEIGAVTVGPVGGATGGLPYKLVLLGRRQAYLYHIQDTDTWPWLNANGTIESSIFEPAGGRVVSLREVRILGRDFDGVAVGGVDFYYRYDAIERWSKLTLGARPPFVAPIKETGKGTTFQWTLGITMTQTEPIRRPVITRIEADFQILPDAPNRVPQRAMTASPRG